jgi:hypothetical protein
MPFKSLNIISITIQLAWIMPLALNIISCMHNHSTWMVQYAFEYYQHITIQPNSKGLSCITIMVHSRKE